MASSTGVARERRRSCVDSRAVWAAYLALDCARRTPRGLIHIHSLVWLTVGALLVGLAMADEEREADRVADSLAWCADDLTLARQELGVCDLELSHLRSFSRMVDTGACVCGGPAEVIP